MSGKRHPLDFFFNPSSVAVIGASAKDGKIGNVVFSNFVRAFRGRIFPINPNAEEIYGVKAYPSIKDVSGEVDLAVIAVPAAAVPKVLAECGQKKVKCVTIISAGFAEIGNHKLQKELDAAAKKYPQTKVMGPNCLGVLDTKSGVDMLFLPNERLGRPKQGSTAFLSQSGALGSAILDWDALKGYGISKFASYGNANYLDESDYINYLADDEATKVIALYVEGVKSGKRFFSALKNAAQKKPVIVLKGGKSEAGAKAVQSHTASLAGSAQVLEAAVTQANAVVANTMEEVFDYARVFSTEPAPKGNRVQVMTDGGGYGVLATDAIDANGMRFARMTDAQKQRIREACPPYAVIENPIDLLGDATNARYKIALEAALEDDEVDAVLTILLFQVPLLDDHIVEDIRDAIKARKKPVLFVSAGGKFSETQRQRLEETGTSTFQSPFEAVSALRTLHDYYERKRAIEAEAGEPAKSAQKQSDSAPNPQHAKPQKHRAKKRLPSRQVRRRERPKKKAARKAAPKPNKAKGKKRR